MFQPYPIGGNAAEYLTQGLGRDDYYLSGYEPPGIMYGSGCADLGIEEGRLVTKDLFCNLADGFSPGGKTKLVQNAGSKDRQKAWDGVFSASKDISIAYARATPEERAEFQARALAEVKLILDDFEKNYLTSRVGAGGQDQVEGRLVCAIFPHLTSRTQDVQLHWHVVFFNVCTRDRGAGITDSGTIQSKPLYTKQKLMGAQFQTAMYQVAESLGLLSEGHGKDTRLVGVSKELCDLHSKRHQEIEKEVQRTGANTAKEKEQIQRRTRWAKERVPQDVLLARWGEEFDRFGLTGEAFAALHKTPPQRDEAAEVAAALERAERNLTNRQSYFSQARFSEEAFVEARGRGVGTSTLRRAVERHLGEDLVELSEVERDKLYTTADMMALERRYFSELRAARGANKHRVSAQNIERAIREVEASESKAKGEKVTFTREQREAVYRMCSGDDAICVVTGDAGSGKSFVCKAAALAFGRGRCLGATIARKAAIGFQESTGIESTSVAKLIGSEELNFRGDLELSAFDRAKHHFREFARAGGSALHEDLKKSRWGRVLLKTTPLKSVIKPHTAAASQVTVDGKILFVDEATQLSSREMEKLIRLVRERGGKVCLIGDAKQHQPIAAGQPFAAASQLLGEARLTQIIRQKHEADQEVSRAFSRGDAGEALKSLVDRGRFHQEKTMKEAMERMVSDWAKEGLRKPKDNLLLVSTNAERAEVNRLAQDVMRKAKRLGRDSVTLHGEMFHQGDRIAFTKNSRFLEISNGDMGTITRIGRKRITLRTFHGKQFSSLWSMLRYAEKVRSDRSLWITVKLDSGKVVDIPLERYQDFRLSYCQNSYQAQGMTVKNCFCLLNPTTLSRESIYVSATRAKEKTTLYTAGVAMPELILRASASRAKKMAHDVLRHEHTRSHSR
jgi:conjugative relaxase-like TrwC/TraI family protein